MQSNIIVCHYDEIALKGNNRSKYESRLMDTIRVVLTRSATTTRYRVVRLFGRIAIIFKKPLTDVEQREFKHILLDVFGIAHFAFAVQAGTSFTEIYTTCLSLIKNTPARSFRVTAQRSDKSFPHTSPEIQQKVGAYILEHTGKKVDLHHPDITCYIHIVDGQSIMYTEKIAGARGLPIGVSGHVLTSLSGGIDSPVATHMMQKRGAHVSCIHFHVYPYTSKASIEKVRELTRELTRFQNKIPLHLIPFADIQNVIASQCPQRLRIVLYRRMMLRISEAVARKTQAKALVTGEALAQVASQTLENIQATNEAVSLPIFRPLIGFDKIEIIERAQSIGTYAISIRPHDDACTRFVPQHPETRAKLTDIHDAEKALNIPHMIQDALTKQQTEVIVYDR